MNISEITPEYFFDWLDKHYFLLPWKDGYFLEDEAYDDIVPFSEYFKNVSKDMWAFAGQFAMCLVFIHKNYWRNINPKLYERMKSWYNQYFARYAELDREWRDLVESCDGFQKYIDDKNLEDILRPLNK